MPGRGGLKGPSVLKWRSSCVAVGLGPEMGSGAASGAGGVAVGLRTLLLKMADCGVQMQSMHMRRGPWVGAREAA